MHTFKLSQAHYRNNFAIVCSVGNTRNIQLFAAFFVNPPLLVKYSGKAHPPQNKFMLLSRVLLALARLHQYSNRSVLDSTREMISIQKPTCASQLALDRYRIQIAVIKCENV